MKKISFCLFSLYFALITLGCYDHVFFNITKEVSLASSTVSGAVNSIARYTYTADDGEEWEYLVTQNGKSVYYKVAGDERKGEFSAWKIRPNTKFKSASYNYSQTKYEGEYIIKLASDEKNIYIITAEIAVDSESGEAVLSKKKLYYTNSLKGNSWELIDFPKIDTVNSTIFCTNAIFKTGRKAYFRNGSNLYLLDGSNVPTEAIEKSDLNILDPLIKTPESKKAAVLNSVVYFKDDFYFFTTLASAANDTMIYYGGIGGIYYSNNGSDFKLSKIPSVGTISCITLTSDYLIFGQGNPIDPSYAGGGIYKVALGSDGVPGNLIVPFTTNADAAFTSSYQLVTLLTVDPSKSEKESIMYASINFKSAGSSISVSYDNLGLWAYYPSRGNWNRE